MSSLNDIKSKQNELTVSKLTAKSRNKILSAYKKAGKRLLLLDYDGTLVGFSGKPEQAVPDEKLYEDIAELNKDEKNEIVIISGRDKETLDKWLGNLDINLVGEHGGWIKRKGEDWHAKEFLQSDWKTAIRPVLELFTDRTPGAIVEEKDFSLVWHYRKSDPGLAHVRIQELKDAILGLTANFNIGVFEGNKIVEIKRTGINKGSAVELWLNEENWDFILAAGDDYTDEYMFSVLPETAYSIKVGYEASKARFSLASAKETRELLEQLAQKG